jgi:cell division protein FtsZ
VKTIMSGMGMAMMGTGIMSGEDRTIQAAKAAISSPLLEGAQVAGARGVIINITGGADLSLMEVNEASLLIQEAAHEEANIIFGAVVDPKLEGRVKVTVIATGFDVAAARQPEATGSPTPVDLQQYTSLVKDRVEAPALDPGRLTIARRPTLDLAAVLPSPQAGRPGADSGDVDLDALSAFDVPAFLRREG